MSDKSTEVTYKFHLPDQKDEVWMVQNASKMYEILWDIQEKSIKSIKYCDRDSEREILMEIFDMIADNIDLYEVE